MRSVSGLVRIAQEVSNESSGCSRKGDRVMIRRQRGSLGLFLPQVWSRSWGQPAGILAVSTWSESQCPASVMPVSRCMLGKLKNISTTVLARKSPGTAVVVAKSIICFDQFRQLVQSVCLLACLLVCSLFVFQVKHEHISTFLECSWWKDFAISFFAIALWAWLLWAVQFWEELSV